MEQSGSVELQGGLLEDFRLIVVDLARVDPPSDRVRQEVDRERVEQLAASLQRDGMLQAPGVRQVGDRFRVVWGEHRIEAARWLGWRTCSVRLVEGDADDDYIRAAVENLERSDLSPVEESVACQRLYDRYGQDVDRVCRAINRTRGWVEGRIRMGSWPADVREAVHRREISSAAAAELAAVTDEGHRRFLLGHAVTSGATARTCQAWRIAWEQSGVVPDPCVVQVAPGGTASAPVEAELPCYITGRRLPFGQLVHVWIAADVMPMFVEFCEAYREELSRGDGAVGLSC